MKVLIVLISFVTAHAAILHVPGEYLTIQAALVSAETGDTILVASGRYYEHIVWPNTQGIDLVSEYGAESTIIDAVGSLRAITIETNVDSTTAIKGFTIVNGNEDYGGGIYCVSASPTISNNTIMNNFAAVGGGVFCSEGDPVIIENIITDNVAAAEGGGISCSYFSNPKIIDNVIENNSSLNNGGGVFSVDSWPEITGNTINQNSADAGGGMHFFKSTPTITFNTVSNNDAEYGDGLYFLLSGGDVNHNDIYGNGYGIYNATPGLIDAEYNWWGDSTGPYHPSLNPGGLGDSVSDGVYFIPWLFWPVSVEEQPIIELVERHKNLTATIFRGPLQLPEGKECRVYDIAGMVVEPGKIQPGIYFIEIDGVVTQKVVKVR